MVVYLQWEIILPAGSLVSVTPFQGDILALVLLVFLGSSRHSITTEFSCKMSQWSLFSFDPNSRSTPIMVERALSSQVVKVSFD